MTKKVLILAFMAVSYCTYSQNNPSNNNVQSDLLKKDFKIQHIKTKSTGYQKESDSQTKSSYNNWERQILDAMIVTEIPKDFPKYTTDMTDEQYKAIIISWANANPTLFK